MTALATQLARPMALPWAMLPDGVAPVTADLDANVMSIVTSNLATAESVERGRAPKLVLITGGIASGKSTLYNQLLKSGFFNFRESFAVHDPDLVMNQLPAFREQLQHDRRGAWSRFEAPAYQIAMTALRIAVGARFNIVAMRTLGNQTLPDLIGDLAERHGYELEVHVAHTPLNIAMGRAAARAEASGRYIPPSTIVERYSHTIERLPQVIRHAAQVHHWDTCSAPAVPRRG